MKTEQHVNEIMQSIPEKWRTHWCDAGLCACLGCVQVGNRQVIAEKITNTPFRGDPEYIREELLVQRNREVYEANKLTYEEWQAWMARQMKPNA